MNFSGQKNTFLLRPSLKDSRRSAAELPAIKWRQRNLDKLLPDKRASLVAELEKVVSV
jgi:hypothetical protein